MDDLLTPQGIAALATLIGAITGMVLALRKGAPGAAAPAAGEQDGGPQGVRGSTPPKA
ncbi:MAG TPA: hypothetical protein VKT52_09295 [Ktedonobacterales bacterium]|nr:hypothetical protein [Ktedonobacterales bacterium]